MDRTSHDDDAVEQPLYQEKPKRRKRAAPAEAEQTNSDLQYYGEEELHQPKIRRATRYLDPASISSSTSAKLTRVEKPLYRHSSTQIGKERLSDTSTRMPSIEKTRPNTRTTPRLAPPEQRKTVEDVPETDAGHIMVTQ